MAARLDAACRKRRRVVTLMARHLTGVDRKLGPDVLASVAAVPWTTRCAVVAMVTPVVSVALAGAPQPPPSGELPVSFERIRAGVEKPEGHALDAGVPLPLPAVRFDVTVEGRTYMLSFEEQLHKDLEPTLLQRQSRDWASKCCGLDLNMLFEPIDRALQRRKERRIRQQIARELEELEASRRK